MCCNNFGFLTTKTDPFNPQSPSLPLPSPQIRPDPLPRISFSTHPPTPQPIRLRVASRSGSCSAESEPKEETTLMADYCSFYELLGIPETGSMLEIKQAYKQLARKYHPDVSPPGRVGEYTRRFIRVQEAYETLSDPNRRALYDRDMAKGLHLVFNARRRYQNIDEQLEEKSEWKKRWQAQVSELKRRSMHKDTANMSWGARMRKQNNESSS